MECIWVIMLVPGIAYTICDDNKYIAINQIYVILYNGVYLGYYVGSGDSLHYLWWQQIYSN